MGKVTALVLGVAALALVATGLVLVVGLVYRAARWAWRRREASRRP